MPNGVIVSCEPGTITAKRAGSKNGVVKLRDGTDAWTWMEDAQNGKYSNREWIAIDTLSTLERLFMKQAMKAAVAAKPHRDLDLPDKGEHQKAQNELKRFVEQACDLPQNVLFLAHAMVVDGPDGGEMYMPTISGGAVKGYAVCNYVMALMNMVGYLAVRSVKEGRNSIEVHRILWRAWHDEDNDVFYHAKDQFNALGRYTDDTTMPELISMINGPTTNRRRRS
jgi:hypothetical protein